MTPRDYREAASLFANLAELFSRMAEEPEPTPTKPGQVYISRSGAATLLGKSREFVRQRILAGDLKEYPAGLRIAEVMEYAAGKPAGAPGKDYRIESPRAAAKRGLKC